jgi:pimeloyl-ACP methyl ester carboxylesterase
MAQTPSFEMKWEEITAAADRLPIQPKCKPERRSTLPGTTYQGIVILIHGFTGCPPQFDALAEKLNEVGFETFSMLLPGEGRLPQSNGHDDLSAMPDEKNWRDYFDLSAEVNDLASRAEGLRIIGGLSIGGALALEAALEQPSLYDRVMLFSPFFDPALGVTRTLLELTKSIPALGDVVIEGGNPCRQDNREGRVGTCSFKIKGAQSIQSVGRDIYPRVAPLKQTQVQIVGVTDDDTAYAEDMRSSAIHLGGPSSSVSACFFPKGVNHSIISTTDDIHENKWWLPGLLTYATRFIATGETIPTAGLSKESPFHLCDVISGLPH